jgi:hypothetical protein
MGIFSNHYSTNSSEIFEKRNSHGEVHTSTSSRRKRTRPHRSAAQPSQVSPTAPLVLLPGGNTRNMRQCCRRFCLLSVTFASSHPLPAAQVVRGILLPNSVHASASPLPPPTRSRAPASLSPSGSTTTSPVLNPHFKKQNALNPHHPSHSHPQTRHGRTIQGENPAMRACHPHRDNRRCPVVLSRADDDGGDSDCGPRRWVSDTSNHVNRAEAWTQHPSIRTLASSSPRGHKQTSSRPQLHRRECRLRCPSCRRYSSSSSWPPAASASPRGEAEEAQVVLARAISPSSAAASSTASPSRHRRRRTVMGCSARTGK